MTKKIDKLKPADDLIKEDQNEETTPSSTNGIFDFILNITRTISKIFSDAARLIVKGIDKLIPPFAPKIKIEEKLIPKEANLDYALIRHYSEFQILLGFIMTILGLYMMFTIDFLLLILVILGMILVLTGFEIEELYITSIRLLIRRISFIERFIRVPADEEHLLKHVVSFSVGRAPPNKILIGMSIFGPVIIAFRELGSAGSVPAIVNLIIVGISLAVLIMGLRLGRRAIVINMAGGHTVLLGIRKGVPEHILHSLIKSAYAHD